MPHFIELIGASGVAYRFRLFEGQISPVGGNFVYVREVDGALHVVCCGTARALMVHRIWSEWAGNEMSLASDALYLRLNVSTRIRTAEHDDLVLGLATPLATFELE